MNLVLSDSLYSISQKLKLFFARQRVKRLDLALRHAEDSVEQALEVLSDRKEAYSTIFLARFDAKRALAKAEGIIGYDRCEVQPEKPWDRA